MKLSNKQKKDLEVILYFAPSKDNFTFPIEITDKDIEDFFNYSDKGIKPEDFELQEFSCDEDGKLILPPKENKFRGFHYLKEGKKWRGRHIHEIYEPDINYWIKQYGDILKGLNIGYSGIIEKDTPRSVIDFLKKEMFKGKYSDFIKFYYQELL